MSMTDTIKLILNEESQINAGGFDACVLINAESRINADLQ